MPQIVVGYAAVFFRAGDAGTTFALPSGETERIAVGAFDKTLADGHNITATFAHLDRLALGSTADGSLSLSADATGLAFRLTLPESAAGERVAELVQAGQVRACSIRFDEAGTRSRRVREGGRAFVELADIQLEHISIGPDPAYRSTCVRLAEDAADVLQSMRWRDALLVEANRANAAVTAGSLC